MKERMNELIDIINEADYNYHTLDNPTITDQEYDKYLRELFDIEEAHPEWVRPDSPTQHAGGQVIDEFKKVTHKIPMMSLSDVFSESEVIAFDERIKKEIDRFMHGMSNRLYPVILPVEDKNKEYYMYHAADGGSSEGAILTDEEVNNLKKFLEC